MHNEASAALTARVQSLEVSNASLHLITAALIQTHPRRDDFQLTLASMLELQAAELQHYFSVNQLAALRESLEAIQRIAPLAPGVMQDTLRPTYR